MRKFAITTLLLILILCLLGILYFDILGLRTSKESVLASIIAAEDTRRVSGRLIELLSDSDSEIRARAALAIGRIGDAKAVDRLFELLQDTSLAVGETATFAIGLAGTPTHAIRLLDMADNLPASLLADAVQAVGRLTDSTMTDIISEIETYLGHIDHRVREEAAYALWRAGARSSWPKLADICRSDPVRPVRIAALYALTRLGVGQSADIYMDWLPDADPFVRSLALKGLALSKDSRNVTLIASGLNDRSNNVVSQAISSLTAMDSPRAIAFLKDRYINETDEKIKVQLLQSLAELDDNAIVDYALDDIHDDSGSANVKSAAIIYLAKINKEAMISLIDSLADVNNYYINLGLINALGEIGGQSVKPRLMAFFNDSLPQLRTAALDALCGVDQGNLDYYIKTALGDKDFVVNIHAINKIGELKMDQYLPQLEAAFVMAGRAATDVKLAIIESAGKFLSPGTSGPSEDIVSRGIHDDDYLVSREAARIYLDKLGIDKSAYISLPQELVSERKIKSFLSEYKHNPYAVISTNRGEFRIELYKDIAPLAVYNFVELSEKGFYENLTFHRVVPNFVVQGGDPRGDGWGGPGYHIRCELSNLVCHRGMVGMARGVRDSGGSQFFITLSPQPHLEAEYTFFGQVASGMDVVDKIVRGDTIQYIRIIKSDERKSEK
jgi:cyclophilin family peptidyl-prolyl cis-trans isomerase/HEAT repeat protein